MSTLFGDVRRNKGKTYVRTQSRPILVKTRLTLDEAQETT